MEHIFVFLHSDLKLNFTYETATISSESTSLTYTVKALTPYTSYLFVVRAFNSYGLGPLSQETHATTNEDGMYAICFITTHEVQ